MAVRYPGKCFWAVILLWAVAIAAVWSCRTATAYELHRWKYDHPAITVFDMSNVHGSECARDFNDEAPAREALRRMIEIKPVADTTPGCGRSSAQHPLG